MITVNAIYNLVIKNTFVVRSTFFAFVFMKIEIFFEMVWNVNYTPTLIKYHKMKI